MFWIVLILYNGNRSKELGEVFTPLDIVDEIFKNEYKENIYTTIGMANCFCRNFI